MEAQSSHPCPLGSSFAELVEDPRQKRKCRYSLESIFTIAILAILAGAENWSQVAMYAQVHKAFLRGFLELPSGRTPSHDTESSNNPCHSRQPSLIAARKHQNRKNTVENPCFFDI